MCRLGAVAAYFIYTVQLVDVARFNTEWCVHCGCCTLHAALCGLSLHCTHVPPHPRHIPWPLVALAAGLCMTAWTAHQLASCCQHAQLLQLLQLRSSTAAAHHCQATLAGEPFVECQLYAPCAHVAGCTAAVLSQMAAGGGLDRHAGDGRHVHTSGEHGAGATQHYVQVPHLRS